MGEPTPLRNAPSCVDFETFRPQFVAYLYYCYELEPEYCVDEVAPGVAHYL